MDEIIDHNIGTDKGLCVKIGDTLIILHRNKYNDIASSVIEPHLTLNDTGELERIISEKYNKKFRL